MTFIHQKKTSCVPQNSSMQLFEVLSKKLRMARMIREGETK